MVESSAGLLGYGPHDYMSLQAVMINPKIVSFTM